MLGLVNLPRDVRYVTFGFINLSEMICCSKVNRAWKDLSLESAKSVYHYRYQRIINHIFDAIQTVTYTIYHETFGFSVEANRLKFVDPSSILSITSFSQLESTCDAIQDLMSHALLDSRDQRRTVRVVNIDRQVEYIKADEGLGVEEVDRNFHYGDLTKHLLNVFRNFHNKGLLEEALIVGLLIPTEEIGSLIPYRKKTIKSDSLELICHAFIRREMINKVLKIALCIPSSYRKNHIYAEAIRCSIRKKGLKQAFEIARFIKPEISPGVDGIYNRRFIAYEEIAKAYLKEKNKRQAVRIRNLIPDNDPDGCKNRLNKALRSKCIIA